MATLTAEELAELRRDICKGQRPNFTKVTINSALQAVETWFEANRASIKTAINTSTAPYVFTNPMKKILIAHYLKQKFKRENV